MLVLVLSGVENFRLDVLAPELEVEVHMSEGMIELQQGIIAIFL